MPRFRAEVPVCFPVFWHNHGADSWEAIGGGGSYRRIEYGDEDFLSVEVVAVFNRVSAFEYGDHPWRYGFEKGVDRHYQR